MHTTPISTPTGIIGGAIMGELTQTIVEEFTDDELILKISAGLGHYFGHSVTSYVVNISGFDPLGGIFNTGTAAVGGLIHGILAE